jgi:hypothetical protein
MKGGGAMVYSVSTDGVDNNGNFDLENIHNASVDAGCRLWDAAKRGQSARPKPSELPARMPPPFNPG